MKKAYSAPTQPLLQFSGNDPLTSVVGGLSPPESSSGDEMIQLAGKKRSNSHLKGPLSGRFNSPFVSFFRFPS